MPSDITKLIFNKEKHYSSVRMQQGRVMLDSDWNEQHEIYQHRRRTQTIDVIGPCGVPNNTTHGFMISQSGNLFSINPGQFYINGLMCELSDPVTYDNQPYFPDPPYLAGGEFDGQPSNSPTIPYLNLINGTYIVYLKAWEREITSLDDPKIKEVALGGADTTSRLQTVWQVGILPVENGLKCTDTSNKWDEFIAKPLGIMDAQISDTVSDEQPCEPQQSRGYQKPENQLYRIEIHKGGTRNKATYKWSRDNATVETNIKEINGNTILVEDTGKDDNLGFSAGQWVEFVNESTSLNHTPYALSKIKEVHKESLEIILESKDSAIIFKDGMKLRRWDQSDPTSDIKDGLALHASWRSIDEEIDVKFGQGTYKSGDYWLIPARTNEDIEWSGSNNSPHGIEYSYCKLAIMDVSNNKISSMQDCRPSFPSLTGICAEDIRFDNNNCKLNPAETVQQAIDQLCKKREDRCTHIVYPEEGWEKVFELIKDGADAQICFQIGNYLVEKEIVVKNKGNIKINGCGKGTKITAHSSEAALRFEYCKSVSIEHLSVITGKVNYKQSDNTKHLNGSLTFYCCSEIYVYRTNLKCGSSATRGAACLSVWNNYKSPSSYVSIKDSDITIGYLQQGILILNTKSTHIEGNKLSVVKRPPRLQFTKRLLHKKFRRIFRDQIISYQLSKQTSNTNESISQNQITIYFKTHPMLKRENAWDRLLSKNPSGNIKSTTQLIKYTNKLADRILSDEVFRKGTHFEELFEKLERQDPSVASQGITIGGRVGNNIRVINNIIDSVLQGIHIGLSHKRNKIYYSAKSVIICGNTISVTLPATAGSRERHGVFVGNCDSLVVENNNIRLYRTSEAENIEIDGIKIWGLLGQRLMIAQNHLFSNEGSKMSFTTGINVNPIKVIEHKKQQWIVMWNVTPSKKSSLRLKRGVKAVPNTNTP